MGRSFRRRIGRQVLRRREHAIAIAALAGLLGTDDYDTAAMIGQAALWDPLCLLWGDVLVTALALTRPAGRRPPA